MKKTLPYLLITLVVFVFFWQLFIKGLLPIPSDTIIGLYHPFRDLYAEDYPNGIPFKNSLITDPVRQQHPWRELAISIEKKLEIPVWNPYNFAGTPLLANFQSAVFYPLNFLFFLLPFAVGWSILIFLGPLFGGLFLYVYLENLKLSKWSSLLGAITFSFSGFFVSWMEWGTIPHTAIWLPLILLSIDKIFFYIQKNSKFKIRNSKLWYFIFIFSLASSFFSGHLQIFFYLFIFSIVYFLVRWIQFGRNKKILFLFLVLNSLFIVLTAVQWIPTFQYISLSARNVDVTDLNNPGWFIPWQHLIQFIAPDYFGNPATGNYWGTWNYGELVGYVGIIPLFMALFALFFRKDKKTFFFGTIFFLSLVFSLPTFFAKIPYFLNIPLVSTSQPTRLLFLIDFTLAILAALGFDYFLKNNERKSIFYPLIIITLILIGLWVFIPEEQFDIVKGNLILPTLLIMASWSLFVSLIFFRKVKAVILTTIIIIILGISVFDLLRFGWKFTSFTSKLYLFPPTKTLDFLRQNLGNFRIMTADSRILPPNFNLIYKLQSVDGYDPLYLLRYGELIAASERKRADINPPFGFNRIITPHNYESRVMDLMGVKYVLSLSALNSIKLSKVFQEGQTIIYENKNVIPRAFFVRDTKLAKNKQEAIEMLLDPLINLAQVGVIEGKNNQLMTNWSVGSANVNLYTANKIIIDTENKGTGFLILTDTFYPTWKAFIDDKSTTTYLTDYNFRGVIVPGGRHVVEFRSSLF